MFPPFFFLFLAFSQNCIFATLSCRIFQKGFCSIDLKFAVKVIGFMLKSLF